MRWFLFVLLFCSLAAGPAVGQALRFQRFTTQHGLSHNFIRSMAQDEQGFIWLGTDEGLSRFDGLEFRNYYPRRKATDALPGTWVSSLAPAPGGLWLSSLGGMARYDTRTDRFEQCRLHLPGVADADVNVVNGVLRRRNGELWVTTKQALWRLDARGRVRACRPFAKEPFAGLGLPAKCEDREGRLWLTSPAGLQVYDPATDTFWNREHNPRGWRALAMPQNPLKSLTNLMIDRRGRTWFSTWHGGFYCFDPATNDLRHWRANPADPVALPDSIVTTLLEDRTGKVWLGTYNAGLVRFDEATNRFERFFPNASDPYALPHRHVNALLEDRQGNVWVGTEEGLALVTPLATRFESWTVPGYLSYVPGEPPQAPDLNSVLEDRAGRLWLGTYGQGLIGFDPKSARFRHFPLPWPPGPRPATNFNMSNLLWEMTQDGAGLLWLATQQGVVRFDPDRGVWLPLPPVPPNLKFLENQVIGTVHLDRDRNVWLAGFHYNLTRYDPLTSQWRTFGAAPHPDRPDTLLKSVMGIAQDRAGNYWLAGVRARGLARLPAGGDQRATWFTADGRQAPADNEVNAVLVDSADGVWVGTARTGLHHRDPRTGAWQTIGREDGLGANNVQSITVDGQGRLWVGTVAGLALHDPRTGRTRTFTQADGLPENIINKARLSARTGDLWLVAAHHLLRVRPDEIPLNREPPPLSFTRFEVNGRPRTLPAGPATIVLQPGETTLSFDFAALNLLAPSGNRYAWKLDGADATWTPPTSRRSVTYAGLAPGDYSFRVRAANNDGIWNRRGLTVHLTLLPPWYATWWFRTLLVLAGATILYTFYHLRLARVLALQGARNQIARDLHDDVGSTLSSILIQSRMPPNPARAEDRLHKIGDSSQRMLDALHDIVWAVNPDHDPLPSVIARMRAFAAQTLEARGITLDFEVEGRPDTVLLRLSRRRDFYLIFKEVITNAAKYADATRVRVRLTAQTSRLRLEVSDDGQGFDLAAPARGSGNGLRNLRQRAGALGGTFSLESALGEGTKLDLAFRPG